MNCKVTEDIPEQCLDYPYTIPSYTCAVVGNVKCETCHSPISMRLTLRAACLCAGPKLSDDICQYLAFLRPDGQADASQEIEERLSRWTRSQKMSSR